MQSNFNLLFYLGCWQYESDKRPDIHQVISKLNEIYSENNNVSTNSTNLNSEENGIVEVSENEDFEHFSDCNLSKLQSLVEVSENEDLEHFSDC